ncbi:MAG TPA: dTMP kinase [Polyangiales bacterium]|nr:dTMP kinase [Polyangiales bacterium]
MEPGRLIVLEGVDGSGTTTQCRLLAERLRGERRLVHTTAQPSAGPVGSLLRLMLGGRVLGAGQQSPAWNQMALLFAADRIDHLDSEILPNLRDGLNVICDRYDHSSVAYQSVSGEGPQAIAWIREVNRFARRPDMTIVLDVPPALAAARRRARNGRAEIFDDDPLQARLCAFYAALEQHFPGEPIVHIDGARSVDEVATAVLAAVTALATS